MKKTYLLFIFLFNVIFGFGQISEIPMYYDLQGGFIKHSIKVNETTKLNLDWYVQLQGNYDQAAFLEPGCLEIEINLAFDKSYKPYPESIASISGTGASQFNWTYSAIYNTIIGISNTKLYHNNTGTIAITVVGVTESSTKETIFDIYDVGNCSSSPVTLDVTLDFLTVSGVLPVNLISFTAKPLNSTIQLSWKITGEENFSEYIIQKSNNSIEFSSIGTINGKNLKSGIYNFTDNLPSLESVNYYRLKMVDLDGTSKLSKIVSVDLNENAAFVSVENPIENGRIVINTNIAKPKFNLLTAYGQQINIGQINNTNSKFEFEVNNTISGIYYLIISSESTIITKKVFFE